MARDRKIEDAIKVAQRQIDIYAARIEHARGDRSRQEEFEKRRRHWEKHLKRLRGKQ